MNKLAVLFAGSALLTACAGSDIPEAATNRFWQNAIPPGVCEGVLDSLALREFRHRMDSVLAHGRVVIDPSPLPWDSVADGREAHGTIVDETGKVIALLYHWENTENLDSLALNASAEINKTTIGLVTTDPGKMSKFSYSTGVAALTSGRMGTYQCD